MVLSWAFFERSCNNLLHSNYRRVISIYIYIISIIYIYDNCHYLGKLYGDSKYDIYSMNNQNMYW